MQHKHLKPLYTRVHVMQQTQLNNEYTITSDCAPYSLVIILCYSTHMYIYMYLYIVLPCSYNGYTIYTSLEQLYLHLTRNPEVSYNMYKLYIHVHVHVMTRREIHTTDREACNLQETGTHCRPMTVTVYT